MKKNLKLLLPVLALPAVLLAGCGETSSSVSVEPEEVTVYFGLGSAASYADKAATDTAGAYVQTDLDVAAVLFDEDGKVIDVNLDVMQVKAVSTAAEVTTLSTKLFIDEAEGDIASKWELGALYAMSGTSPISKEWDEQADAYENWAVGKTVAEITDTAILTDYHGGKALTDGATVGVTVTVDGFMAVITEAWENKIEVVVEDAADLKVGVAMNNSHAALQDDVAVGGAILDAEDKVVASKFDVYQIPYAVAVNSTDETLFDVTVNTTSKKQVDATNLEIKSKHDLGAEYGMTSASPIAKEWYEQADAFAAYVVGKTAEEIADPETLVDYHGGKALEDGATVGTTMTIDAFLKLYAEVDVVANDDAR